MRFSTEIALYLGNSRAYIRDRPMIAMERLQEVIGGGSIRVSSDDLEGPLTMVSMSLCTYKSNISKTVCILRTKLLYITLTGNDIQSVE